MPKLILILLLAISLYADKGTLIKIVDGDTLNFKTNGKTVKCRIAFIDTPESQNNRKNKKDAKSCKNVSNKDLTSAGKSATRYAKRLLNLKSEYDYAVNGKDRYKRSICVVTMGNTTFNEQMVLGAKNGANRTPITLLFGHQWQFHSDSDDGNDSDTFV